MLARVSIAVIYMYRRMFQVSRLTLAIIADLSCQSFKQENRYKILECEGTGQR